jgi:hypothetical protein
VVVGMTGAAVAAGAVHCPRGTTRIRDAIV